MKLTNIKTYMPMSNSTNSDFSHKNGQETHIRHEKLHEGHVKKVKLYLDKLTVNCEKVSNQSVKKVMDFAKSYRVIKTKSSGPVEIHLN
jgi:hypothetical protein